MRTEIGPGTAVDLADYATRIGDLDRDDAQIITDEAVGAIARAQERLYAEGTRALLVVFQAMDTGGKDGAIRRVFHRCHVQGVDVQRFQAPGPREQARDFLWRCHQVVPEKGYLGVFNRSHYEAVVTERVLDLAPGANWQDRYRHINDFERLLHDTGTRVVKFFLHVSRDEQRKRLQRRLERPDKQWKLTPDDLSQRALWSQFQTAYADALSATSTRHAPWHIIPADAKWQRDYLVAGVVARVLEGMDPRFPPPGDLPKSIPP